MALSPSEVAAARALLSAAELELFSALQGREQRHAMDVLRWLRAHAEPSLELQTAALVHNVGKGRIELHERVIHVLLQTFAPGLLARLADPAGWRLRSALARLRDHPERGAERLAAIGASPRVRELVRRHHDPAGADPSAGEDRELGWLMEADGRC